MKLRIKQKINKKGLKIDASFLSIAKYLATLGASKFQGSGRDDFKSWKRYKKKQYLS